MSEQILDDANIHTLFEEVRGEAVPQSVDGHRVLEAGRIRRRSERPRNCSWSS